MASKSSKVPAIGPAKGERIGPNIPLFLKERKIAQRGDVVKKAWAIARSRNDRCLRIEYILIAQGENPRKVGDVAKPIRNRLNRVRYAENTLARGGAPARKATAKKATARKATARKSTRKPAKAKTVTIRRRGEKPVTRKA